MVTYWLSMPSLLSKFYMMCTVMVCRMPNFAFSINCLHVTQFTPSYLYDLDILPIILEHHIIHSLCPLPWVC